MRTQDAKVAVITGGNKGLGLAQTRKFLSQGYAVHVVARSKGALGELEGSVAFHAQDLGDWADTSYLEGIRRDAGRLDVLVNNAGMHLKKPVWEVSPDELDQVLSLNVKSLFMACGAFIRLAEAGGAIVNISSMAGLIGLPSAAAYVTAKTAVIGLTRSVAVDGAPRGIRCNAVCPGFIETEMTRAVLARDPERRARIEARIPGGLWGRPEDVAEAVFWLAGEGARYVNGVALPVDNGYAVGF